MWYVLQKYFNTRRIWFIKEGVVINLNNEEVTITDIMKNVGFYYKNKSGEVKFCNTMFETLNFEPVFE